MINKQQYEAQLRQIFKLLLENKTQDEIARELNIGVRTVARYSQRIEKRYGEMQRQETDNTLYTECNLFKNRMLTLYRGLEQIVTGAGHGGIEKAKCAEVAANIAINVLKMEGEGIKKVIKDALMIAENEATKRRSSPSAISSNSSNNNDSSNMMYYDDESEESC